MSERNVEAWRAIAYWTYVPINRGRLRSCAQDRRGPPHSTSKTRAASQRTACRPPLRSPFLRPEVSYT